MKLQLLFLIIVLILGVVIGYSVSQKYSKKIAVDYSSCGGKYVFVNPQLGCRPPDVIKKYEYTAMQGDLQQYIAEEKTAGYVSHVSIYFRDLQYGPTLGINEQERFAPASLLKVPLLMTYLNLASEKPSVLEQKISYSGEAKTLEQIASNSTVLEKGKPYTVNELLQNTIKESDNLSYSLLVNALREIAPQVNLLSETMQDLGLVNPRQPSEDTITVKSYSSLFRHLYNSSYLTPDMSEKALKLLSETSFTQGLVRGLPNNISVAHKFGERTGLPDGQVQLHDCGIVYYPDNSYLLCIMTRGTNYKNMAEVISNISKKVYQEVDSRRIN